MIDAHKIRKDFPILERRPNGKKLVYFDNTATTQKPVQVINAVSEFYEKHNANIHRGVHTLSQEASDMYDKGRENISRFIGSMPDELIFTRNATESINLIAYSWGMENVREGDEIIITGMEHHSNIIPWHFLSRLKGAKIRQIEFGDDYSVSLESLQEIINTKTKIISVSHFSNVLGTINPVKEMCRIAKDNNCLSIVDGAQSAPHIPVNVKKIGCDFFAFSAHKMIGPTGIGGLYGREEILSGMRPFMGGGGMIKDVSLEMSTYDTPPGRFEAGTPDISGVVGFSAAIDYLEKIGMENIEKYEQFLNEAVIKKIKSISNVKLYGPENDKKRGAVFSFEVEGMNPHDVAMLFDHEGIAVRSGHHCAQPLMKHLGIEGTVRASPYIYNTKEEIEFFLETLEKIASNTC